MQSMTQRELGDEIARRQEINFVASAITPWHALGVNAVIHKLYGEGIRLQGYVILNPHPVTGQALDIKNFLTQETEALRYITLDYGADVRETGLAKIKRKLREYYTELRYYGAAGKRFGSRRVYWAVPLRAPYSVIPKVLPLNSGVDPRIILVDEGMGSYLNTNWTWLKVRFRESGWKAALQDVPYYMFLYNYYEKRLRKRGQLEAYQTLIREDGRLIPNQRALPDYRYAAGKGGVNQSGQEYEGAVVINADLLSQIGIIRNDADIPIYEELCRKLHNKQIPVLLKPHPRCRQPEKYRELLCTLETESKEAQESIFAKLMQKPRMVVGVDSTSLVTASVMFGIRSASIIQLFPPGSFTEHRRFRVFQQAFEEVLEFPKTMEELLELISGE